MNACLHLFTQGLGSPSFSSLERILVGRVEDPFGSHSSEPTVEYAIDQVILGESQVSLFRTRARITANFAPQINPGDNTWALNPFWAATLFLGAQVHKLDSSALSLEFQKSRLVDAF
jgi:hypothetical protein